MRRGLYHRECLVHRGRPYYTDDGWVGGHLLKSRKTFLSFSARVVKFKTEACLLEVPQNLGRWLAHKGVAPGFREHRANF